MSLLAYEVNGVMNRVIWKRMGCGKGLTEQEAHDYASAISRYERILRQHGWVVPMQYHRVVVPVENEFQIFSYEEAIGEGDMERRISNPDVPNFERWHGLRLIVQHLLRYKKSNVHTDIVVGKRLTRLPHGLDLKPANVALGNNGLYFLDLFPPKEHTASGELSLYSKKLDSLSPEKLIAVCATREGALLRCYRLAERAWIASAPESTKELREGFLRLLQESQFPHAEFEVIQEELESEYPWLDSIYNEQAV